MSGGKGGSTTSQTQIPDWIAEPAQRNIARAEEAQQVGYIPYTGPEVAAFSPTETALMQSRANTGQMLGILPQGFDAMSGMPRNVPQNVTQFDTPTTSEQQLSQIYMEELGRPLAEEGRSYWLQQSGIQDPNQIRQAVRQSEEAMAFQRRPQEFAGGIRGYSSMPLYEQAVAETAMRAPGQAQAYQDLFINPQTGGPSQSFLRAQADQQENA